MYSQLVCDPTTLASAICCLILVVVLVCFTYKRGGSHIEWAYHIGDQPVYRLLFLIVIAVAAFHRTFFPVALLLATLFMVINNMVPMLTELDETFVFGAPLTSCDAYSAASVKAVGTPFYPINVVEKTTADDGGRHLPEGVETAEAVSSSAIA